MEEAHGTALAVRWTEVGDKDPQSGIRAACVLPAAAPKNSANLGRERLTDDDCRERRAVLACSSQGGRKVLGPRYGFCPFHDGGTVARGNTE